MCRYEQHTTYVCTSITARSGTCKSRRGVPRYRVTSPALSAGSASTSRHLVMRSLIGLCVLVIVLVRAIEALASLG